MAAALRLEGVSLRAGKVTVLDEVDFRLERGETGLVVGPSGSGKSQLLRLINRLRERTSGTIEVLGRAIDEWAVPQLRRRVGWVPQRPSLSDGTAMRILQVPLRLGIIDAKAHRDRLEPALEAVALPRALLERQVARLSGGERHRVAVARALLLDPELLLLDEPSSALDGASAARLLAGIDQWASERGATLVVVTHRIEDVRTLDGRLLVLQAGRVARSGPVAEVLEATDGFDVHALMTGRTKEAAS